MILDFNEYFHRINEADFGKIAAKKAGKRARLQRGETSRVPIPGDTPSISSAEFERDRDPKTGKSILKSYTHGGEKPGIFLSKDKERELDQQIKQKELEKITMKPSAGGVSKDPKTAEIEAQKMKFNPPSEKEAPERRITSVEIKDYGTGDKPIDPKKLVAMKERRVSGLKKKIQAIKDNPKIGSRKSGEKNMSPEERIDSLKKEITSIQTIASPADLPTIPEYHLEEFDSRTKKLVFSYDEEVEQELMDRGIKPPRKEVRMPDEVQSDDDIMVTRRKDQNGYYVYTVYLSDKGFAKYKEGDQDKSISTDLGADPDKNIISHQERISRTSNKMLQNWLEKHKNAKVPDSSSSAYVDYMSRSKTARYCEVVSDDAMPDYGLKENVVLINFDSIMDRIQAETKNVTVSKIRSRSSETIPVKFTLIMEFKTVGSAEIAQRDFSLPGRVMVDVFGKLIMPGGRGYVLKGPIKLSGPDVSGDKPIPESWVQSMAMEFNDGYAFEIWSEKGADVVKEYESSDENGVADYYKIKDVIDSEEFKSITDNISPEDPDSVKNENIRKLEDLLNRAGVLNPGNIKKVVMMHVQYEESRRPDKDMVSDLLGSKEYVSVLNDDSLPRDGKMNKLIDLAVKAGIKNVDMARRLANQQVVKAEADKEKYGDKSTGKSEVTPKEDESTASNKRMVDWFKKEKSESAILDIDKHSELIESLLYDVNSVIKTRMMAFLGSDNLSKRKCHFLGIQEDKLTMVIPVYGKLEAASIMRQFESYRVKCEELMARPAKMVYENKRLTVKVDPHENTNMRFINEANDYIKYGGLL